MSPRTKTAPMTIDNPAFDILNREGVPSAELAAARVQAREARRIAAEETTAAESAYRASLLSPTAAASFEAKNRLDAATVERDRAAALVDELTRRHDIAIDEEKEAARRSAYDKAAAEVATAQKRLLVEYPKLASQIALILEDCRTAELRSLVVNENLPRDAEPLRRPDDCRNAAAAPEEIVSTKTRMIYCHVKPERPEYYNFVEQSEVANIRGSSLRTVYGQIYPVALLPFDEIVKRPASPAAHAQPLHETVLLPGVTARDLPIWGGKVQPRYDRQGDEIQYSKPDEWLETVLVRK